MHGPDVAVQGGLTADSDGGSVLGSAVTSASSIVLCLIILPCRIHVTVVHRRSSHGDCPFWSSSPVQRPRALRGASPRAHQPCIPSPCAQLRAQLVLGLAIWESVRGARRFSVQRNRIWLQLTSWLLLLHGREQGRDSWRPGWLASIAVGSPSSDAGEPSWPAASGSRVLVHPPVKPCARVIVRRGVRRCLDAENVDSDRGRGSTSPVFSPIILAGERAI